MPPIFEVIVSLKVARRAWSSSTNLGAQEHRAKVSLEAHSAQRVALRRLLARSACGAQLTVRPVRLYERLSGLRKAVTRQCRCAGNVLARLKLDDRRGPGHASKCDCRKPTKPLDRQLANARIWRARILHTRILQGKFAAFSGDFKLPSSFLTAGPGNRYGSLAPKTGQNRLERNKE